MKTVIISTILLFVVILEATIPNSSMVVGSSEWLDAVRHCVGVYHEENNSDDYYDCMLELDASINSDDG